MVTIVERKKLDGASVCGVDEESKVAKRQKRLLLCAVKEEELVK